MFAMQTDLSRRLNERVAISTKFHVYLEISDIRKIVALDKQAALADDTSLKAHLQCLDGVIRADYDEKFNSVALTVIADPKSSMWPWIERTIVEYLQLEVL